MFQLIYTKPSSGRWMDSYYISLKPSNIIQDFSCALIIVPCVSATQRDASCHNISLGADDSFHTLIPNSLPCFMLGLLDSLPFRHHLIRISVSPHFSRVCLTFFSVTFHQTIMLKWLIYNLESSPRTLKLEAHCTINTTTSMLEKSNHGLTQISVSSAFIHPQPSLHIFQAPKLLGLQAYVSVIEVHRGGLWNRKLQRLTARSSL